MTPTTAYRHPVAVVVGSAVFLVLGMGALGVVGSEGDPADFMFFGVLAIGIAGSVVAPGKAGRDGACEAGDGRGHAHWWLA